MACVVYWAVQVQALIDRHQPAFAAGGCQLSLQRAQHSHWVQIDVNPHMAVGQPGGDVLLLDSTTTVACEASDGLVGIHHARLFELRHGPLFFQV